MIPKYSEKEAYSKLQSYCAYQERAPQEVREKLRGWGFSKEESEVFIAALIEEDFLNEQRFAESFVGGKFRLKRWGRIKIQQALLQKGISETAARRALKSQISKADYHEALLGVLQRKANALDPELPLPARRQKLAAHGMSAGYESDLVWEKIEELLRG